MWRLAEPPGSPLMNCQLVKGGRVSPPHPSSHPHMTGGRGYSRSRLLIIHGWNCSINLGHVLPLIQTASLDCRSQLWGKIEPSAHLIPVPNGLTSTRSSKVTQENFDPWQRAKTGPPRVCKKKVLWRAPKSPWRSRRQFPGNHLVLCRWFLKLLQCLTLNKLQQRRWTFKALKDKKKKLWETHH